MVDNKRKHKYTNSRNNAYSFSKKKESEAKEIFYWCIEHYKFWIALFSIFGGICVACYKFGMFISDVESKIEYNNLIQDNNEKLAKQKSEFDQAIQALNKEIRDKMFADIDFEEIDNYNFRRYTEENYRLIPIIIYILKKINH